MNINKEIDYGKHSISIDIDFDKCRVKRPIFLFMYQNNSSNILTSKNIYFIQYCERTKELLRAVKSQYFIECH